MMNEREGSSHPACLGGTTPAASWRGPAVACWLRACIAALVMAWSVVVPHHADAQSYYVELGGIPAAIHCTGTSITVGAGMTISGHLARTAANAMVTAYVGDDGSDAIPVAAYPLAVEDAAEQAVPTVTTRFHPRAFPYAVRMVYQPVPSGEEAAVSFSCPAEGLARDLTIAGHVTPLPGLWSNPDEMGSGYALDYRHDVLVVIVFSYDEAGAPTWYIASGPLVNNTLSATLHKYRGGQCIHCGYVQPIPDGEGGDLTIVFTSATSARMSLPGGREFAIEPLDF